MNGYKYGIRVFKTDRDTYFKTGVNQIVVEIDKVHHEFKLTPSFWRKCSEFRDGSDPVIHDWLQAQRHLTWETGCPPRFVLTPLGGNRFRLEV